jgi:hypothetical protein
MTAIYLDDLYWQEDRKEPEFAYWEKQIPQLTTGERWLIDCNHASTLPARINLAYVVILRDTPVIVCLYRIISHAVQIMIGKTEYLPARIRKQALERRKVNSIIDNNSCLYSALKYLYAISYTPIVKTKELCGSIF